MHAVFTLTAALLLGQTSTSSGWGNATPEFAETAATLRTTIVARGYKRVGVVSRLTVALDATKREALAERLGPIDEFLAETLRAALAERAGGRFEVLKRAEAAEALYDLRPEAPPERWRQVAEALGGMDAVVFAHVTDPNDEAAVAARRIPAFQVRSQLIDVQSGQRVAQATETLRLSIAGAAYLGDSFELRRWKGSQLTNVALHKGRTGLAWASAKDFSIEGKYDDICRLPKHPLSISAFPFRISVMVDGVRRPVVYINRQAYVALDMGEEYALRIENQCGSPVYTAVFVDGINILGKEPQHPANCRYWHLRAGATGQFGGWYSDREGGRYLEEAFRIGMPSQGPAAQQGYYSRLGQITAVFYTIGMPRVETPTIQKKIYVPGPQKRPQRIWTPNGWAYSAPAEPEQERIATVPGTPRYVAPRIHRGERPGLILAAITIRYRTTEALNALKQNHNWSYWDVGRLAADLTPEDKGEIKVRFGVTARRTDRSARHGGVEVLHVIANSPGTNLRGDDGRRYRLVAGRDVITHVNGRQVGSEDEFRAAIERSPTGATVRVRDMRTNSHLDYYVTLWGDDDTAEPPILHSPQPSPRGEPLTRFDYYDAENQVRGHFRQVAPAEWVEVKGTTLFARFSEIGRTAHFIDLYDASRHLTVRLTRDLKASFRVESGPWHPIQGVRLTIAR